jgi:hypothetical protein
MRATGVIEVDALNLPPFVRGFRGELQIGINNYSNLVGYNSLESNRASFQSAGGKCYSTGIVVSQGVSRLATILQKNLKDHSASGIPASIDARDEPLRSCQ